MQTRRVGSMSKLTMFRASCLTAALCLLWVNGACALEGVPDAVQKIIDAYNIPDGAVSMLVQEVGADSPLASRNTTVPRNPASSRRSNQERAL